MLLRLAMWLLGHLLAVDFIINAPPPLKRGDYCFALVGWSVDPSVDQMLSAMLTMLIPLLESSQTCFYPWRVDVLMFPIDFQVKCQGQTNSHS